MALVEDSALLGSRQLDMGNSGPLARIIVGGIVLGAVVGACDRTPRQVAPTAEPVGLAGC